MLFKAEICVHFSTILYTDHFAIKLWLTKWGKILLRVCVCVQLACRAFFILFEKQPFLRLHLSQLTPFPTHKCACVSVQIIKVSVCTLRHILMQNLPSYPSTHTHTQNVVGGPQNSLFEPTKRARVKNPQNQWCSFPGGLGDLSVPRRDLKILISSRPHAARNWLRSLQLSSES